MRLFVAKGNAVGVETLVRLEEIDALIAGGKSTRLLLHERRALGRRLKAQSIVPASSGRPRLTPERIRALRAGIAARSTALAWPRGGAGEGH
jgi:hypothetical protein